MQNFSFILSLIMFRHSEGIQGDSLYANLGHWSVQYRSAFIKRYLLCKTSMWLMKIFYKMKAKEEYEIYVVKVENK